MPIQLRKIEPEDLPFLYQWENDASAWADADNHNPLSHRDLRDYIESTTGDIYRDGQIRLVIELLPTETTTETTTTTTTTTTTESRLTIGCIDLFDLDARNRKAALGMYIAPEFRGQGYGRQAVAQTEQYAFQHLNLRMIYAIIRETNIACRSLYQSMGYQPTAHLRAWTLESDAVVWQKISE